MFKRNLTLICLMLIFILLVGCSLKNEKHINYDLSNVKEEDLLQNRFLTIIDEELDMYLKYNNLDDITNQDKLWFIYNKYIGNYLDNCENNCNVKEFMALNLQTYFTNSSIIDYGYKYEDIYCPNSDKVLWYYNDMSSIYTINEDNKSCDKENIEVVAYKLINYYKKNNKYILDISYLFKNNKTNSYYGKYNDALNNVNGIVINSNDGEIDKYFKDNYEFLKNNLSVYSYTFTYNNKKIKLVDFIAN